MAEAYDHLVWKEDDWGSRALALGERNKRAKEYRANGWTVVCKTYHGDPEGRGGDFFHLTAVTPGHQGPIYDAIDSRSKKSNIVYVKPPQT